MAFRFNFSTKDTVSSKTEDTFVEPVVKKQIKEQVAKFKEIAVQDCKTVYPCDLEVKSFELTDKVTVHCYDAGAIEEILKKDKDESSIVVKATSCHSDLVPNVYEGGLTIWECGVDLAYYIADNVDLTDKKVLELGCGAGIPGISAISLCAAEVHFQDYNSEVLEEYTIPNVTQLNLEEDSRCRCRYFSGDWAEFSDNFDKKYRYDVILTAETIYSPDNYQKLHDVFTSRLKKDGVIFVAAKSNYFGVGGGTGLFEDFIKEQDQFKYEVCKTIDTAVPREILKLTWKKVASKEKVDNT